jgi:hypothetical protein
MAQLAAGPDVGVIRGGDSIGDKVLKISQERDNVFNTHTSCSYQTFSDDFGGPKSCVSLCLSFPLKRFSCSFRAVPPKLFRHTF